MATKYRRMIFAEQKKTDWPLIVVILLITAAMLEFTK